MHCMFILAGPILRSPCCTACPAGAIALSRRYVISTPYVRELSLAHEDEFLIMASDGLWDVVPNEVRGQDLENGGMCVAVIKVREQVAEMLPQD